MKRVVAAVSVPKATSSKVSGLGSASVPPPSGHGPASEPPGGGPAGERAGAELGPGGGVRSPPPSTP